MIVYWPAGNRVSFSPIEHAPFQFVQVSPARAPAIRPRKMNGNVYQAAGALTEISNNSLFYKPADGH